MSLEEQQKEGNTPEILPAIENNNPNGLEPAEHSKRVRYGIQRANIEERKAQVISLSIQGLNHTQISRATGMPATSVKDVLKKFSSVFKSIEKLDDFRQVKSDLIEAAEIQVLESALTPKKLEKASFLATITGLEKLHKIERLERGKSTENIAHGFGKLPIAPDASEE